MNEPKSGAELVEKVLAACRAFEAAVDREDRRDALNWGRKFYRLLADYQEALKLPGEQLAQLKNDLDLLKKKVQAQEHARVEEQIEQAISQTSRRPKPKG